VDTAASELGLGRRDTAKLLARWAEQGWLRRVRRGLYVAVPVNAERPDLWRADPLVLATAVWSPCYFTGWTAAGHWGLTEQVFDTIVVRTGARVRSSEQTLLDQAYLVGRVSRSYLGWGTRSHWLEGTRIDMADEARTVVDILGEPAIGGGIRHGADILMAYCVDRDPRTLLTYADRLENAAIVKRLGYLCERLDLADEPFLEECEGRLSAGVALLDPTAPASGSRDPRWKVRVNVSVSPTSPS